LVVSILIDARPSEAAYAAEADELALLALCNQSRAAGGLAPLVWSNDLGRAARAHSDDMADHGCYQHNSCNGTYWSTRVRQYYASPSALGENIALGGSNPRVLHDAWMESQGHRANIMGSAYTEFGAGIALGETNFGVWAYATEDFGNRGAVARSAIPTLPAGGVVPRIGGSESRELVVNYYHHNGSAPVAVRALVGSSCVNLAKTSGAAANGSYGATRAFSGSGCVPVVFEAIRADGVRARWPENEALLVGVGAGGLYCAETTTAVPTQDCGGGSGPAPTPTPGAGPAPTPAPTPRPDGGAGLNPLRVVLKPGEANQSKGNVQVQATLPQAPTFDPSAAPVTVHVRFGGSGDWRGTLPALCGSKPCLKPNTTATVFNGKHGQTTMSFIRAQNGKWKLRVSARNQTLGSMARGSVSVSVTAGGRTFSGSAHGELKDKGLVAE
jgi:hypothetical protein